AAGETSKTVSVTVYGDAVYEGDESMYVNLSNASGASMSDNQGVGTITDDDGQPTISINDASVTEGNSGTATLDFTVSLNHASASAVTVDYATVDHTATIANSDYVEVTTTSLTFAAGETSKTVSVTVYGDAV
ncbi:Calx-beta domain-containing protein, partial [Plebeiibacterium sediminum]